MVHYLQAKGGPWRTQWCEICILHNNFGQVEATNPHIAEVSSSRRAKIS